MNKLIKKNILDLQFQKYLIIASTSIIIAFTYIIGIGIAFLTEQINFDFFYVIALFVFSFIVLGLCAFLFFKAVNKIREIPKVMENFNS